MEINPETAEITLKKVWKNCLLLSGVNILIVIYMLSLTLQSFDRELQSSYTCTITAIDQSRSTGDRLTATALLDLLISDVNDSPPEFIFPAGGRGFKFAIYEGMEPYTRVGHVSGSSLKIRCILEGGGAKDE